MQDDEETGEAGAGRVPAYGTGVLVGAVFVLLAITVLIMQFTVPWLIFEPADQTYDRDEVDDAFSGMTYHHRLITWPVAALIVLIIVGVGLAAADLAPALGPMTHRAARAAAAGLAAYAGFVLALTGTRWLGVLIENRMLPGDPRLSLHVMPYVNLASGLAVLWLALWALRGDLRWTMERLPGGVLARDAWRIPALAAAVAAVCLLAIPLLPFSVTETFIGDIHFLEPGYATLAERDSGGSFGGDAGRDLGWVRWMLWTVLYLSAASFAAALMERSGRDFLTWGTIAQVYALNAVPVVLGAVFTVLAYVHMADQTNTTITFNHLHTLALLVIAATGLRYWGAVLRPFLQHAARPVQQTS